MFFFCIFLGIFGLISEGGEKNDPTASLQQSPTCETCEDFSCPQNAWFLFKSWGQFNAWVWGSCFFWGGGGGESTSPCFHTTRAAEVLHLSSLAACEDWFICLRTSCFWIPDPLRWHSVIWHCHPHCLVQIKHSSRRVNSTLACEFKEHVWGRMTKA